MAVRRETIRIAETTIATQPPASGPQFAIHDGHDGALPPFERALHRIFLGPDGLRPIWRLAAAVALYNLLVFVIEALLATDPAIWAWMRTQSRAVLTPGAVLFSERARTFIVAGFFSGMLAGNEIPAGLLSAAATLVVLRLSPKKTLIAYLPPALLVTAAFFGTNWIAVHRTSGRRRCTAAELTTGTTIPAPTGTPSRVSTRARSPRASTRRTCSSDITAFFRSRRCGCFSCSAPGIWLVRGGARLPVGPSCREGPNSLRWLAFWGLLITLICFAFYIWFDGVDRNYGGNASAFRWVFWLAPLWLALMLPASDLLSRRAWSRAVGLVLLAGLGPIVPLSDMESLERPVDHELPGIYGLVVKTMS